MKCQVITSSPGKTVEGLKADCAAMEGVCQISPYSTSPFYPLETTQLAAFLFDNQHDPSLPASMAQDRGNVFRNVTSPFELGLDRASCLPIRRQPLVLSTYIEPYLHRTDNWYSPSPSVDEEHVPILDGPSGCRN